MPLSCLAATFLTTTHSATGVPVLAREGSMPCWPLSLISIRRILSLLSRFHTLILVRLLLVSISHTPFVSRSDTHYASFVSCSDTRYASFCCLAFGHSHFVSVSDVPVLCQFRTFPFCLALDACSCAPDHIISNLDNLIQ